MNLSNLIPGRNSANQQDARPGPISSNSILARVLHEQGRAQINKSRGTPEEPNCEGFTPGELASIDFSKIDLSEYMQYVKHNLSISPEKYQEIVEKTRGKINEKNRGE